MTTFVLIPGAGGSGAIWPWLVDELRARGHDAVPLDIREDDPSLGLPEYAQIVLDAVRGCDGDVVLVGQSMGGFTAPVVASTVPVAGIVLLNAMVPLPGEAPGPWFDATGAEQARHDLEDAHGRGHDFDLEWHFLNELPPDVRESLVVDGERQPADTPFRQPCEFERWPDVPTRVITARDDHFFPARFQQRVARERLGVEVELVDGGHLVAAGNPVGVAELLTRAAG